MSTQIYALSAAQVAERLQVSVRTVDRWRYKGIGPPCFKIGKHIRYAVVDLESWIAQSWRRCGLERDPLIRTPDSRV